MGRRPWHPGDGAIVHSPGWPPRGRPPARGRAEHPSRQRHARSRVFRGRRRPHERLPEDVAGGRRAPGAPIHAPGDAPHARRCRRRRPGSLPAGPGDVGAERSAVERDRVHADDLSGTAPVDQRVGRACGSRRGRGTRAPAARAGLAAPRPGDAGQPRHRDPRPGALVHVRWDAHALCAVERRRRRVCRDGPRRAGAAAGGRPGLAPGRRHQAHRAVLRAARSTTWAVVVRTRHQAEAARPCGGVPRAGGARTPRHAHGAPAGAAACRRERAPGAARGARAPPGSSGERGRTRHPRSGDVAGVRTAPLPLPGEWVPRGTGGQARATRPGRARARRPGAPGTPRGRAGGRPSPAGRGGPERPAAPPARPPRGRR